jgi:hypothetical protein
MDEQVLEDFLLDKIDGKDFAEKVFNGPSCKKDSDFLLTRNHLLKLCDLAIERKIGVGLLTSLSDHLMFSDHFKWNKESEDGDIVSQTIFEWVIRQLITKSTSST